MVDLILPTAYPHLTPLTFSIWGMRAADLHFWQNIDLLTISRRGVVVSWLGLTRRPSH